MANSRPVHDDDRFYIPPKKLEAIRGNLSDPKNPIVSIFWRPDRKSGSQLVYPAFPRDIAIAFSPKLTRVFDDTKNKSFVIFSGSLKAHKTLFDWMMTCVQAGKIQNFPHVDMDNVEVEPFKQYAKLLESVSYFEINDLHRSLFKRILNLSHKHLMSVDEAELYINGYDISSNMMQVAVESIAYAFHDGKFDEDVAASGDIGDLRAKYGHFDEMLAGKVPVVKDEIREAKQAARERRQRKAPEDAGGSGAGLDDGHIVSVGNGSGWNNGAENVATGDWAQGDTGAVGAENDWEKTGGDQGSVGNWDEHMEAEAEKKQQQQQQQSWASTPTVTSPEAGW